MPITLNATLPAAATLGAFVDALPALMAAPGVFGIFDTTPASLTISGGGVAEWASRGGLTSAWVQPDAGARPTIDSDGRVSMGGSSRLELPGLGTVPAFTIATRFASRSDAAMQTIFAGSGNGVYARAFWQPSTLRTRFGDASALRDIVSPPVPLGVVYVVDGTTITLHTGGQSVTWTGTAASYALVSLVIGAQTTSAAPDSFLRYGKFGVWRAALAGQHLANAKAWVGA